jgi:outer membrane immunogenic protein
MNNVLLFITGGLALGGATSQRTFVDNTTWVQMETALSSSTRVGWTIGAGAEWAFSPSWTVQAQYLYADLGAVSNSGVIGPPPPPNNTTTMRTSARLTRQIGSLGVNYHF